MLISTTCIIPFDDTTPLLYEGAEIARLENIKDDVIGVSFAVEFELSSKGNLTAAIFLDDDEHAQCTDRKSNVKNGVVGRDFLFGERRPNKVTLRAGPDYGHGFWGGGGGTATITDASLCPLLAAS